MAQHGSELYRDLRIGNAKLPTLLADAVDHRQLLSYRATVYGHLIRLILEQAPVGFPNRDVLAESVYLIVSMSTVI